MIDELIRTYIYKKDEEGITLLPEGIIIWNKIVQYLKNKFNKLEYKEIYSSNLESYVINNVVSSKYYSLNYNKDTIEFLSYGKFEKEIEEARNDSIDVLEIYNLLGKELLGIPFNLGKNVFNQDKNIVTTILGETNINSSYLGKKEGGYISSSRIDMSIIKTLINVHKDEKGMVFSPEIAPIQIAILPIKANEKGVLKTCKLLCEELIDNNFRVIFNDKLTKDVIIKKGIPLIIEIGPRDVEKNELEITLRDNFKTTIVSNDKKLKSTIDLLFKNMHKRLYLNALEKNIDNQKIILNRESMNNIDSNCINKVMWCGDLNCLELGNSSTVYIPFNQQAYAELCLFCSKKSKHLISIIKKYKN